MKWFSAASEAVGCQFVALGRSGGVRTRMSAVRTNADVAGGAGDAFSAAPCEATLVVAVGMRPTSFKAPRRRARHPFY